MCRSCACVSVTLLALFAGWPESGLCEEQPARPSAATPSTMPARENTVRVEPFDRFRTRLARIGERSRNALPFDSGPVFRKKWDLRSGRTAGRLLGRLLRIIFVPIQIRAMPPAAA